MSEHQITLSLEGLPEDDGAIKLGVLIHELQTLNSLLLGIDRHVSPEGRLSTEYRIVDLRRVNPAEIVIAGSPKSPAEDIRSEVFSLPFNMIDNIEAGETKGFDYELLEKLQELLRPLGAKLRSASLKSNGRAATLTTSLRRKIDELLEPTYTSIGFIQGRLEAVNVHEQANAFRIYPRVGPGKVSGRFPESMRDMIGWALGKDVIVYGVLEYRSDAQYAHSILAESLEIIPEIEKLPDLRDLPKATKELLDGLTSEQWLRNRREENREQLLAILGT